MNGGSEEAAPDWSALLDDLKDKELLTSDAQLANALGVTRGYICSVRKGRKNVSLDLAREIFSRLGRSFDLSMMERLFVPIRIRSYTSNISTLRGLVISRAGGHCQLCGEKAPFQAPDGSPYLELHHLVSVSNGGSDTPENLVALCPNCYTKIKVCPTARDTQKLEQLKKSLSQR
jgi:transcriptional regulator with XRE-family HTH domain